MRVSTPQATAIDLVRYEASLGGLGAVATVLDELVERVDPVNPSRFVAVGFSNAARVLVVVNVTRAERTRLLSARRATIGEEYAYAERRGQ